MNRTSWSSYPAAVPPETNERSTSDVWTLAFAFADAAGRPSAVTTAPIPLTTGANRTIERAIEANNIHGSSRRTKREVVVLCIKRSSIDDRVKVLPAGGSPLGLLPRGGSALLFSSVNLTLDFDQIFAQVADSTVP